MLSRSIRVVCLRSPRRARRKNSKAIFPNLGRSSATSMSPTPAITRKFKLHLRSIFKKLRRKAIKASESASATKLSRKHKIKRRRRLSSLRLRPILRSQKNKVCLNASPRDSSGNRMRSLPMS